PSRPRQFPTSRRRPSDPKITVAGHVLENSALDVVGQTPAVLIEPARELALLPTLASPHDGIDDATEESAARRGGPRRHHNGSEIMARSDGVHGCISARLILETFSFETSGATDVDRASST